MAAGGYVNYDAGRGMSSSYANLRAALTKQLNAEQDRDRRAEENKGLFGSGVKMSDVRGLADIAMRGAEFGQKRMQGQRDQAQESFERRQGNMQAMYERHAANPDKDSQSLADRIQQKMLDERSNFETKLAEYRDKGLWGTGFGTDEVGYRDPGKKGGFLEDALARNAKVAGGSSLTGTPGEATNFLDQEGRQALPGGGSPQDLGTPDDQIRKQIQMARLQESGRPRGLMDRREDPETIDKKGRRAIPTNYSAMETLGSNTSEDLGSPDDQIRKQIQMARLHQSGQQPSDQGSRVFNRIGKVADKPRGLLDHIEDKETIAKRGRRATPTNYSAMETLGSTDPLELKNPTLGDPWYTRSPHSAF